jgi:hypothetical protein
MGFFDFIKKVGGGILNGISKVGGGILNVGNKVKDGISKGFDVIKKIPIIGDIAQTAVNIPLIKGKSIADIAGIADQALKTGEGVMGGVNALKRGDIGGAIGSVSDTYNNVQNMRGRFGR